MVRAPMATPPNTLHVYLKAQWFDMFWAGTKTVEYRHNSGQYAIEKLTPGRPVILYRGWSGYRMSAVIDHANIEPGTMNQGVEIHLRNIQKMPNWK